MAIGKKIAWSVGVTLGLVQAAAVEAALVAYWTFDNTSANAVFWGPQGSLKGGATFSNAQTAPVGWSSHSLSVTGATDQEFAVSDSNARNFLKQVFEGDFTISFWARSNVDASGQGADLRYMFDFGFAHESGVGVVFNDSHGKFGGDTNTIGYYYFNTARDSGVPGLKDTWYHVVVSRRGDEVQMYIDGTPAGTPITPTPGGTISAGTYPFVAGGEAKSGTRGWNGYIDEVAIWDRALSAPQIQQLASGAASPWDILPLWDFQHDVFDASMAPDPNQAVGPWIQGARWRYGTQKTVTDGVYTGSTIDEFEDFTVWNSTDVQWQSPGGGYPSVRISNKTLHAGNVGSETKDVAVMWEATFAGFVAVDYQLTNIGGGDVGYQMLQWDASAAQMRLLQPRRTYSGLNNTTGRLQVRTRVEPGDRILFVLDNAELVGGDRQEFFQTIQMDTGPQAGEQWSFAGDKFDKTSLMNAAGPWRNSARWRYMYTDTSSYTSPSDFTDFADYTGTQWQLTGGYPSVRLTDMTIHPGPGEQAVVVAWEADFWGGIYYEFQPAKFYSYTSVQYQLLQWDAAQQTMLVLADRNYLDDNEPPLVGYSYVRPGDILYFVVDNNDGTNSGDRVYLAAMITAVPEPASCTLACLALGGLALLGLGGRRR